VPGGALSGGSASVRLGGSGGDLGRSEPLVGGVRAKLVCLTRMDRVSPGDGWCPWRTCCAESLDLTRNLVLAIFQSGLDNPLCRLFGGVGVLPLGFFRYLHTPPARAPGGVQDCPSGVHTGLGVTSVRCGGPGSVANGAFSSRPPIHLYPDGVALNSGQIFPLGTVEEVQNVRRDRSADHRLVVAFVRSAGTSAPVAVCCLPWYGACWWHVRARCFAMRRIPWLPWGSAPDALLCD
jgi:hypothetical protein